MIYRATKEDIAFILEVYRHPEIYPLIAEEDERFKLNEEMVRMLIETGLCYFLILNIDNKKIGYAYFHPFNSITYVIHPAILPEYQGMETVSLGKEVFAWMFKNTPCRKIIGEIPSAPSHNRVLGAALKLGATVEGILTNASLRDGKLYDLYLVAFKEGN